jgi:hypothetical protein
MEHDVPSQTAYFAAKDNGERTSLVELALVGNGYKATHVPELLIAHHMRLKD